MNPVRYPISKALLNRLAGHGIEMLSGLTFDQAQAVGTRLQAAFERSNRVSDVLNRVLDKYPVPSRLHLELLDWQAEKVGQLQGLLLAGIVLESACKSAWWRDTALRSEYAAWHASETTQRVISDAMFAEAFESP